MSTQNSFSDTESQNLILFKPRNFMCGRFAQIYDDSALMLEFKIEDIQDRIYDKFNLSPGMEINTIVREEDRNSVLKHHWGIDSVHGHELQNLVFNTRSDTFLEKPFGKHFHQHRCIIPISGFYEWKNKLPYYVKFSNDKIISLAGVFEDNSCSVITVDSTGPISNIHHRMPLMLFGDNKFKWLDNSSYDQSLIEQVILDCFDQSTLEIFRVSDHVNSLYHDSAQCIIPLQENSLF